MRKVLWIATMVGFILFYACATGPYRLTEYEKGQLKGYHANEANRLIDVNQKNRKANQKEAEKYRQEQTARLSELNRTRQNKKNGKSHSKLPFNQ